MKLFTVVTVGFLLALPAFAAGRTLTCRRDVLDSTLTATFHNVGSRLQTVSLWVPTGEFTGNRYTGRCTGVPGAIEHWTKCQIFTSTDSGYYIDLQSIGSSTLYATVKHWTMGGEGKPETLPCK